MSYRNDNGNNSVRNMMVPYTPQTTSVSPTKPIEPMEANIMVHELQSKLDDDYRKTNTSQTLIPLPPAHIETNAIQLVKEKSFKLGNFTCMEDLLRSILGNWNTFIAYAKNELEEKNDQIYGTGWERAMAKANKESGWSEIQKIIFSCKETLTPLFTIKASPIIQKGISLFGTDFESFAKTTFMANVIQDLLEFIIQQIYAALGGPGAGKPRSWLEILLELGLLILKWILFFLVQVIIQKVVPGYPLIASLLTVTPFFIKYIIEQVRSKIRK